jgi:glycosyltransferase involved in cell wall biosynthesis
MTRRFSVVTPVYDPPADVLRATIESVLAQTFTDWELILVDDCSPSPHVIEILRSYEALDERIVVRRRSGNGGIVAASNDGLELASGQFIGLLDHDDTLVPEALRLVDMYARQYPDMDYCYSDEDLLAPDGRYVGPFYKPDWSPERLRAQNYCTHLSVFSAGLLEQIGGFRTGFDGSQDYDLILRATEQARQIVHIPLVLYHWRQIATSVATGDPTIKPYAYDAGCQAVREHCARTGIDAEISVGRHPGNYRVVRRVDGDPLTSIVISTAGTSARVWGIERCHVVEAIGSARSKTSRRIEFVVVAEPGTPPEVHRAIRRAAGDVPVSVIEAPPGLNAGERYNLGAASALGDFLLLMHDDVELISDEFLDPLLGLAAHESIGAVGCKSYFADGRLRHCGYVHNGNPHEIMQGFAHDEPGHRGLLTVAREVTSVSGACLLLSRDVYFRVGGLSPRLERDFSDVDLGLKLRAEQLACLWTPEAELYDFSAVVDPAARTPDREFIDRRWGHQLREDPFFNPNLQPDRNDWVECGMR